MQGNCRPNSRQAIAAVAGLERARAVPKEFLEKHEVERGHSQKREDLVGDEGIWTRLVSGRQTGGLTVACDPASQVDVSERGRTSVVCFPACGCFVFGWPRVEHSHVIAGVAEGVGFPVARGAYAAVRKRTDEFGCNDADAKMWHELSSFHPAERAGWAASPRPRSSPAAAP